VAKNKANYTETRRDDWETPDSLFRSLDEVFHFEVDLAASAENTKCLKYIAISDDDNGFFDFTRQDFIEIMGTGWAWCNPPYGADFGGLEKWITEIASKVPGAVVLIPAAPGNKWWHRVVWPKATSITFLKGRLTFDGAPQVAQFDSVLLTLGHHCTTTEFAKLLEHGVWVHGWLID
jgi:phage N-6-adenine-methyltransferase